MEPIVLITGATDGLGRQVAHDLAERGATVLVHGRSREKAEDVAGALRAAGAAAARVYVADLARLGDVRRMADAVLEREDRLDVLLNNAGIGTGERRLSEDGIELRLAVNHVAHALLTQRLLGLLRASAPARVVNVSSVGQAPIDFGDPMLERGYSGMRAYAQSKLAQILFTFELAGRLPAEEVTVNALHPATLMDTTMVRESFGRAQTTVREGADAVLRLVTDPALEGVSGRYFEGQREGRADDQAYDPAARERLWQLTAQLTGENPATG